MPGPVTAAGDAEGAGGRWGSSRTPRPAPGWHAFLSVKCQIVNISGFASIYSLCHSHCGAKGGRTRREQRARLCPNRTFFTEMSCRPNLTHGLQYADMSPKICPWLLRSCLYNKSKLGKKVNLTKKKMLNIYSRGLFFFFCFISVVRQHSRCQLFFVFLPSSPLDTFFSEKSSSSPLTLARSISTPLL